MSVLGRFTLEDYKEFEEAVLYRIKFQGVVNLLSLHGSRPFRAAPKRSSRSGNG